MPWVELIAGVYVGLLSAFVTPEDNFMSRALLKAPLLPACAVLIADALARLHFLA